MRCPSFEVLSRAASGEVNPGPAGHIAGCPSCRSRLERILRLRELARELPYEDPGPADLRAREGALLARAGAIRPRARRPVLPAFAAAAAIVTFLAGAWLWQDRPEAPGSVAEVAAGPSASYRHLVIRPVGREGGRLEEVRLASGSLAIRVRELAAGERFVVVVGGAQVEVRGTRFTVRADHGRLEAVEVAEGRVEVRIPGEAPALLAAGEGWSRAARPEAVAAAGPAVDPGASPPPPEGPPAPVVVPVALPTPPVPPTVALRPPPAGGAPPPAQPPRGTASVEAPAAERAFTAGWDAVRSGDHGAAVAHFDRALAEGLSLELGEEAAYWRIVALARDGSEAAARDAMARYLRAYPDERRAGEVALMLGLSLARAGDDAAARPWLERAVADRVPEVRRRAREGLERLLPENREPGPW